MIGPHPESRVEANQPPRTLAESGNTEGFGDRMMGLRGEVNDGSVKTRGLESMRLARGNDGAEIGDAAAGSQITGGAPGISDQPCQPASQHVLEAHRAGGSE